MSTTVEQRDAIMERASEALAKMEYLACEALCLEALAGARQAEDYAYYARILLPLQEARRQRRMIAVESDVQLGSGSVGFSPDDWVTDHRAGCIVLTHPHSSHDALSLGQRAHEQQRFIEVLFADNPPSEANWKLRSYAGPDVTCQMPAPTPDTDAAQWFIDATERLGDAALQSVDDSLAGPARVDALEARLRIFPDHEKLHQRLAEAARAAARKSGNRKPA